VNVTVLVTLISALAWVPGLYMIYDGVRRRRGLKAREGANEERIVVRSAIELLAPYKTRVEELESQLAGTTAKASALSLQLSVATSRANDLADQLESAQTELGYLRVQVKALSAQVRDENPGR
jgi:chromosome segregation ATPase